MLIDCYKKLPSCFITATDTDAGKTHVSCQILKAWQSEGYAVAAFKPVASGAVWQAGQLVSEDAVRLAAVTNQPLDEITTFIFEKPASPHIADIHHSFDLNRCLKQYNCLTAQYDRVLVEGVGGWCVPLSNDLMLKDMANAIALPIVMVARIGLGCINHSLLTIHRIKSESPYYHGWIANQIDAEFADAKANIQSILIRS